MRPDNFSTVELPAGRDYGRALKRNEVGRERTVGGADRLGRTLRRRRVVGMSCVAAMVGVIGVVAVTGTREPASALKLLSGQVWLGNRGVGTVSEVDGYSGRVDGQASVGKAGDPFTVVQRPDGAYVLDGRTGKLSRIGADTLAVAATRPSGGHGSGLQVLTGTGVTWILDHSTGLLQQVNPATLEPVGAQVRLGGPTGTATVDSAGSVWAPLSGTGTVAEVTPGDDTVIRHHPGGPGGVGHRGTIQVVDTSNGVWGINPQTGDVAALSQPTSEPLSIPTAPGPALVGSSTSSPFIVISAGDGQVLEVDTARPSLSSLSSPAVEGVTQIAVAGTMAYLLDPASDDLQTVDLEANQIGDPTPVPAGSDQIVTADHLVFVNDDNGNKAVVVNTDGQVTPITKYTTAPAAPTGGAATPAEVAIPSGPPTSGTDPSLTPTPAPPTGDSGGVAVTPVTLPVIDTPPDTTAPPTTSPPTTSPPPTTPPPTATTTQVPGAPGVPTAVAASATADGTLQVTWSPPASDGGAPVSSYVLLAARQGSDGADPKSTTVPASPGGGQQTGTLAGLTDGETWCAEVQAVNRVGSGPTSPPDQTGACATPQKDEPTAPGAVTATATAAGQAQVTWTAATDPVPSSTVTGYTVTGGPSPVPAGDTTRATVTGLRPGTEYTFDVQATNSVGNSGPTAAAKAITSWAVPTAPSRVAATGAVSSIDVSWSASTSNPGDVVTYTVAGGGESTTTRGTSATLPATAWKSVSVTVTATNSVGATVATAVSAEAYDRTSTVTCMDQLSGDEAVQGHLPCYSDDWVQVPGDGPPMILPDDGPLPAVADRYLCHAYYTGSTSGVVYALATSSTCAGVLTGAEPGTGGANVTAYVGTSSLGPGSVEYGVYDGVVTGQNSATNGPFTGHEIAPLGHPPANEQGATLEFTFWS
jgi:hypothetical protein